MSQDSHMASVIATQAANPGPGVHAGAGTGLLTIGGKIGESMERNSLDPDFGNISSIVPQGDAMSSEIVIKTIEPFQTSYPDHVAANQLFAGSTGLREAAGVAGQAVPNFQDPVNQPQQGH